MRRALVIISLISVLTGLSSSAANQLKTQDRCSDITAAGCNALVSMYQNDPLPDSRVLPPLKQHFEYILPGACVISIEKAKDFKCAGPDKEHMRCQGISITVHGRIDDCLEIHVVKDAK